MKKVTKFLEHSSEFHPVFYECYQDDGNGDITEVLRNGEPFAKRISEDSWELTFRHRTAFKKMKLLLNFCDLEEIENVLRIWRALEPDWPDSSRIFAKIEELK